MLAIVPAKANSPVPSEAAKRIRADISNLEASLDRAMAAAASLAQSMIDARGVSDLPVHTGQIALIRLQRAQAQLVGASSDTFRVHDELARLTRMLGIPDEPTVLSGLHGDEASLRSAA